VKLGEEATGTKGTAMVRSFSWQKKIGFSEAGEDEKFGQLKLEIRNTTEEAIDFELAYQKCEDLVSFTCESGSESGNARACERPHFSDETPNGILGEGKKVKMHCCGKFEKEAKGCHAKIDMRAIGGGVADVDLGK